MLLCMIGFVLKLRFREMTGGCGDSCSSKQAAKSACSLAPTNLAEEDQSRNEEENSSRSSTAPLPSICLASLHLHLASPHRVLFLHRPLTYELTKVLMTAPNLSG